MTVRPSRTSASNRRSGSPDARLRSHESHPKDRPTCADTGVDQAAAIPRISHDQRLTAASDGIWLQVRKQDQGHRSAPELAFCWWQVLGSNQRRLSRRFYIPEGAGRVKGGGVPVFLPVPGQVLGTPKGGPGSRWSARLDERRRPSPPAHAGEGPGTVFGLGWRGPCAVRVLGRLAAAFIPSGVPAAGGRGGMGRVRVRAAGSIRGSAAPRGASKTSDHALPASGPAHPACRAAVARDRTCPSRMA
jgi:hypothetical protein